MLHAPLAPRFRTIRACRLVASLDASTQRLIHDAQIEMQAGGVRARPVSSAMSKPSAPPKRSALPAPAARVPAKEPPAPTPAAAEEPPPKPTRPASMGVPKRVALDRPNRPRAAEAEPGALAEPSAAPARERARPPADAALTARERVAARPREEERETGAQSARLEGSPAAREQEAAERRRPAWPEATSARPGADDGDVADSRSSGGSSATTTAIGGHRRVNSSERAAATGGAAVQTVGGVEALDMAAILQKGRSQQWQLRMECAQEMRQLLQYGRAQAVVRQLDKVTQWSLEHLADANLKAKTRPAPLPRAYSAPVEELVHRCREGRCRAPALCSLPSPRAQVCSEVQRFLNDFMLAESESVKPALPQACKRAPASACMPAARGHTQARSFDRHARVLVGAFAHWRRFWRNSSSSSPTRKTRRRTRPLCCCRHFLPIPNPIPTPTITRRGTLVVLPRMPITRLFCWRVGPQRCLPKSSTTQRASKTHFRLFCAADDLQLLRAERPGADARADSRRRRAQDSSRLLGVRPRPSGLHVVSRSNLASESTRRVRGCAAAGTSLGSSERAASSSASPNTRARPCRRFGDVHTSVHTSVQRIPSLPPARPASPLGTCRLAGLEWF